MSEASYLERLVGDLKATIEKEDLQNFLKIHFDLFQLCRRYIFEADTSRLTQSYSPLNSLFIWFYRTGEAQWPEIEKQMGGLEALAGLIRSLKETRTKQEVLTEIRGSQIDSQILCSLLMSENGILSGQLAQQLDRSQNSLTNRLPNLERKGMVIRAKQGKNSLIFLTPKGKTIANLLSEEKFKEHERTSTQSEKYEDLDGKLKSRSASPGFWKDWDAPPSGETSPPLPS